MLGAARHVAYAQARAAVAIGRAVRLGEIDIALIAALVVDRKDAGSRH